VIGDDRIVLRAWAQEDLETLGKLRNDLTLQEMLMSQPRPNSADRVQDWLIGKSERDDSVFFVIAERDSDRVIGYMQVVNINTLHGTGELGICIGPDWQGGGYGSSAMVLLEDYLKRVFSLRKLLLHVFANNEGAVKFYLKLGFGEVGRMKDHFLNNGKYRDVVIMEKFLAQ
jgi:RimJ/RimL family protein N-acetyltransferase